jgi:hypothetical protein
VIIKLLVVSITSIVNMSKYWIYIIPGVCLDWLISGYLLV